MALSQELGQLVSELEYGPLKGNLFFHSCVSRLLADDALRSTTGPLSYFSFGSTDSLTDSDVVEVPFVPSVPNTNQVGSGNWTFVCWFQLHPATIPTPSDLGKSAQFNSAIIARFSSVSSGADIEISLDPTDTPRVYKICVRYSVGNSGGFFSGKLYQSIQAEVKCTGARWYHLAISQTHVSVIKSVVRSTRLLICLDGNPVLDCESPIPQIPFQRACFGQYFRGNLAHLQLYGDSLSIQHIAAMHARGPNMPTLYHVLPLPSPSFAPPELSRLGLINLTSSLDYFLDGTWEKKRNHQGKRSGRNKFDYTPPFPPLATIPTLIFYIDANTASLMESETSSQSSNSLGSQRLDIEGVCLQDPESRNSNGISQPLKHKDISADRAYYLCPLWWPKGNAIGASQSASTDSSTTGLIPMEIGFSALRVPNMKSLPMHDSARRAAYDQFQIRLNGNVRIITPYTSGIEDKTMQLRRSAMDFDAISSDSAAEGRPRAQTASHAGISFATSSPSPGVPSVCKARLLTSWSTVGSIARLVQLIRITPHTVLPQYESGYYTPNNVLTTPTKETRVTNLASYLLSPRSPMMEHFDLHDAIGVSHSQDQDVSLLIPEDVTVESEAALGYLINHHLTRTASLHKAIVGTGQWQDPVANYLNIIAYLLREDYAARENAYIVRAFASLVQVLKERVNRAQKYLEAMEPSLFPLLHLPLNASKLPLPSANIELELFHKACQSSHRHPLSNELWKACQAIAFSTRTHNGDWRVLYQRALRYIMCDWRLWTAPVRLRKLRQKKNSLIGVPAGPRRTSVLLGSDVFERETRHQLFVIPDATPHKTNANSAPEKSSSSNARNEEYKVASLTEFYRVAGSVLPPDVRTIVGFSKYVADVATSSPTDFLRHSGMNIASCYDAFTACLTSLSFALIHAQAREVLKKGIEWMSLIWPTSKEHETLLHPPIGPFGLLSSVIFAYDDVPGHTMVEIQQATREVVGHWSRTLYMLHCSTLGVLSISVGAFQDETSNQRQTNNAASKRGDRGRAGKLNFDHNAVEAELEVMLQVCQLLSHIHGQMQQGEDVLLYVLDKAYNSALTIAKEKQMEISPFAFSPIQRFGCSTDPSGHGMCALLDLMTSLLRNYPDRVWEIFENTSGYFTALICMESGEEGTRIAGIRLLAVLIALRRTADPSMYESHLTQPPERAESRQKTTSTQFLGSDMLTMAQEKRTQLLQNVFSVLSTKPSTSCASVEAAFSLLLAPDVISDQRHLSSKHIAPAESALPPLVPPKKGFFTSSASSRQGNAPNSPILSAASSPGVNVPQKPTEPKILCPEALPIAFSLLKLATDRLTRRRKLALAIGSSTTRSPSDLAARTGVMPIEAASWSDYVSEKRQDDLEASQRRRILVDLLQLLHGNPENPLILLRQSGWPSWILRLLTLPVVETPVVRLLTDGKAICPSSDDKREVLEAAAVQTRERSQSILSSDSATSASTPRPNIPMFSLFNTEEQEETKNTERDPHVSEGAVLIYREHPLQMSLNGQAFTTTAGSCSRSLADPRHKHSVDIKRTDGSPNGADHIEREDTCESDLVCSEDEKDFLHMSKILTECFVSLLVKAAEHPGGWRVWISVLYNVSLRFRDMAAALASTSPPGSLYEDTGLAVSHFMCLMLHSIRQRSATLTATPVLRANIATLLRLAAFRLPPYALSYVLLAAIPVLNWLRAEQASSLPTPPPNASNRVLVAPKAYFTADETWLFLEIINKSLSELSGTVLLQQQSPITSFTAFPIKPQQSLSTRALFALKAAAHAVKRPLRLIGHIRQSNPSDLSVVMEFLQTLYLQHVPLLPDPEALAREALQSPQSAMMQIQQPKESTTVFSTLARIKKVITPNIRGGTLPSIRSYSDMPVLSDIGPDRSGTGIGPLGWVGSRVDALLFAIGSLQQLFLSTVWATKLVDRTLSDQDMLDFFQLDGLKSAQSPDKQASGKSISPNKIEGFHTSTITSPSSSPNDIGFVASSTGKSGANLDTKATAIAKSSSQHWFSAGARPQTSIQISSISRPTMNLSFSSLSESSTACKSISMVTILEIMNTSSLGAWSQLINGFTDEAYMKGKGKNIRLERSQLLAKWLPDELSGGTEPIAAKSAPAPFHSSLQVPTSSAEDVSDCPPPLFDRILMVLEALEPGIDNIMQRVSVENERQMIHEYSQLHVEMKEKNSPLAMSMQDSPLRAVLEILDREMTGLRNHLVTVPVDPAPLRYTRDSIAAQVRYNMRLQFQRGKTNSLLIQTHWKLVEKMLARAFEIKERAKYSWQWEQAHPGINFHNFSQSLGAGGPLPGYSYETQPEAITGSSPSTDVVSPLSVHLFSQERIALDDRDIFPPLGMLQSQIKIDAHEGSLRTRRRTTILDAPPLHAMTHADYGKLGLAATPGVETTIPDITEMLRRTGAVVDVTLQTNVLECERALDSADEQEDELNVCSKQDNTSGRRLVKQSSKNMHSHGDLGAIMDSESESTGPRDLEEATDYTSQSEVSPVPLSVAQLDLTQRSEAFTIGANHYNGSGNFGDQVGYRDEAYSRDLADSPEACDDSDGESTSSGTDNSVSDSSDTEFIVPNDPEPEYNLANNSILRNSSRSKYQQGDDGASPTLMISLSNDEEFMIYRQTSSAIRKRASQQIRRGSLDELMISPSKLSSVLGADDDSSSSSDSETDSETSTSFLKPKASVEQDNAKVLSSVTELEAVDLEPAASQDAGAQLATVQKVLDFSETSLDHSMLETVRETVFPSSISIPGAANKQRGSLIEATTPVPLTPIPGATLRVPLAPTAATAYLDDVSFMNSMALYQFTGQNESSFIQNSTPVTLVKPTGSFPGHISIFPNGTLIWIPSPNSQIVAKNDDPTSKSGLEALQEPLQRMKRWKIHEITAIFLRCYLLMDCAVELFLTVSGAIRTRRYFFTFENREQRDTFVHTLHSWILKNPIRRLFDKVFGDANPFVTTGRLPPLGPTFGSLYTGVFGGGIMGNSFPPYIQKPRIPPSLDDSGASQGFLHNYAYHFRRIYQFLSSAWQERRLSNFDYLMILNTFGGRSYNDITQYPVLPWVIQDYLSKTLDLSSPSSFRDLSRPLGAITGDRFREFYSRYESMCGVQEGEEDALPTFLYGNHFSTAVGTVVHYLLRLSPFTKLHLQYQSGHFDVADRLFRSVAASWEMNTTALSEVKELTPEWYITPTFLLNHTRYNFGNLQSGETVDHVLLPPWALTSDRPTTLSTLMRDTPINVSAIANGLGEEEELTINLRDSEFRTPELVRKHPNADQEPSVFDSSTMRTVITECGEEVQGSYAALGFIRKMREALESDLVSETLHDWIDLIFGYKQRGPAAIEHSNLFYYLTYTGGVDMDAITDPEARKATMEQIAQFGQSPLQLLVTPHKRRSAHPVCMPAVLPLAPVVAVSNALSYWYHFASNRFSGMAGKTSGSVDVTTIAGATSMRGSLHGTSSANPSVAGATFLQQSLVSLGLPIQSSKGELRQEEKGDKRATDIPARTLNRLSLVDIPPGLSRSLLEDLRMFRSTFVSATGHSPNLNGENYIPNNPSPLHPYFQSKDVESFLENTLRNLPIRLVTQRAFTHIATNASAGVSFWRPTPASPLPLPVHYFFGDLVTPETLSILHEVVRQNAGNKGPTILFPFGDVVVHGSSPPPAATVLSVQLQDIPLLIDVSPTTSNHATDYAETTPPFYPFAFPTGYILQAEITGTCAQHPALSGIVADGNNGWLNSSAPNLGLISTILEKDMTPAKIVEGYLQGAGGKRDKTKSKSGTILNDIVETPTRYHIWAPVPRPGYVAMGCVVTPAVSIPVPLPPKDPHATSLPLQIECSIKTSAVPPPLDAILCLHASLVSRTDQEASYCFPELRLVPHPSMPTPPPLIVPSTREDGVKLTAQRKELRSPATAMSPTLQGIAEDMDTSNVHEIELQVITNMIPASDATPPLISNTPMSPMSSDGALSSPESPMVTPFNIGMDSSEKDITEAAEAVDPNVSASWTKFSKPLLSNTRSFGEERIRLDINSLPIQKPPPLDEPITMSVLNSCSETVAPLPGLWLDNVGDEEMTSPTANLDPTPSHFFDSLIEASDEEILFALGKLNSSSHMLRIPGLTSERLGYLRALLSKNVAFYPIKNKAHTFICPSPFHPEWKNFENEDLLSSRVFTPRSILPPQSPSRYLARGASQYSGAAALPLGSSFFAADEPMLPLSSLFSPISSSSDTFSPVRRPNFRVNSPFSPASYEDGDGLGLGTDVTETATSSEVPLIVPAIPSATNTPHTGVKDDSRILSRQESLTRSLHQFSSNVYYMLTELPPVPEASTHEYCRSHAYAKNLAYDFSPILHRFFVSHPSGGQLIPRDNYLPIRAATGPSPPVMHDLSPSYLSTIFQQQHWSASYIVSSVPTTLLHTLTTPYGSIPLRRAPMELEPVADLLDTSMGLLNPTPLKEKLHSTHYTVPFDARIASVKKLPPIVSVSVIRSPLLASPFFHEKQSGKSVLISPESCAPLYTIVVVNALGVIERFQVEASVEYNGEDIQSMLQSTVQSLSTSLIKATFEGDDGSDDKLLLPISTEDQQLTPAVSIAISRSSMGSSLPRIALQRYVHTLGNSGKESFFGQHQMNNENIRRCPIRHISTAISTIPTVHGLLLVTGVGRGQGLEIANVDLVDSGANSRASVIQQGGNAGARMAEDAAEKVNSFLFTPGGAKEAHPVRGGLGNQTVAGASRSTRGGEAQMWQNSVTPSPESLEIAKIRHHGCLEVTSALSVPLGSPLVTATCSSFDRGYLLIGCSDGTGLIWRIDNVDYPLCLLRMPTIQARPDMVLSGATAGPVMHAELNTELNTAVLAYETTVWLFEVTRMRTLCEIPLSYFYQSLLQLARRYIYANTISEYSFSGISQPVCTGVAITHEGSVVLGVTGTVLLTADIQQAPSSSPASDPRYPHEYDSFSFIPDEILSSSLTPAPSTAQSTILEHPGPSVSELVLYTSESIYLPVPLPTYRVHCTSRITFVKSLPSVGTGDWRGNGSVLCVGLSEGLVVLYDAENLASLISWETPGRIEPLCADICPSGAFIVVGCEDGVTTVFALPTFLLVGSMILTESGTLGDKSMKYSPHFAPMTPEAEWVSRGPVKSFKTTAADKGTAVKNIFTGLFKSKH